MGRSIAAFNRIVPTVFPPAATLAGANVTLVTCSGCGDTVAVCDTPLANAVMVTDRADATGDVVIGNVVVRLCPNVSFAGMATAGSLLASSTAAPGMGDVTVSVPVADCIDTMVGQLTDT